MLHVLEVLNAVGGAVTINLDPLFFVPPGPYISKYLDPPALIWTPMHVINYSRDSDGSGAGFWLAGLVSRVCMAGLVFRGSNYFGVQISRDSACNKRLIAYARDKVP